MFNLYNAPDTAAYRQAQLLDEMAANRLARSANDEQKSTVEIPSSTSVVRRVGGFVAAINGAISGALHLSGSHSR